MPSPSKDLGDITIVLRAEKIPHALIGGWAVISWGYLRTSDDIDLLIDLPTTKRKALLTALSKRWNAEWIAGGQDDPIPGLIRAEPKKDGLPIDMLLARPGPDRDALSRALKLEFEGIAIPVVTPEDLIAMKLSAGGGQDYEDARRLISVLSGKLDKERLRQYCRQRQISERLALILPPVN